MAKSKAGRVISNQVYFENALIDDVQVVQNTLDLDTGTNIDLDTKYTRFLKTMTANTIITLTNPVVGKYFTIEFTGEFTPTIQDPSGFTIKTNANNPAYSSGKTVHHLKVVSSTIISLTIEVWN